MYVIFCGINCIIVTTRHSSSLLRTSHQFHFPHFFNNICRFIRPFPPSYTSSRSSQESTIQLFLHDIGVKPVHFDAIHFDATHFDATHFSATYFGATYFDATYFGAFHFGASRLCVDLFDASIYSG